MTQIKYVNQCAACHTLQFDQLIQTPAPHAKPEIVHAFIVQKLTEYIAAHPEAMNIRSTDDQVEPENPLTQPLESQRKSLSPLRQSSIPEQSNMARSTGTSMQRAANARDWVQQRTAVAERLLWEKNCKICHIVTQGGGVGLPTIVKAIIPVRWFPHAEFDHESHRMVECTGCHLNIPQSRLTSDINVPGIEICRDCHRQAGPKAGAAEGRCFECHSYHDWRNERRIEGKYDISQVRGNGPVAPPITQAETSQGDAGR
jgi:hypothetical protein